MGNPNLVGLVADTHDNRPAIRKAVALFNDRGVGLVLHAGDFVAPFTARDFAELNSPFVGVFGNNDGECVGLRNAFEAIGEIYAGIHTFRYEEKAVVLMHEPNCVVALARSGDFDVIVYGHTHEVDVREEGALIVNPGEASGWVNDRCTVAILNLDGMTVDVIDL